MTLIAVNINFQSYVKEEERSDSDFDKLYGSIHDSVKRKILDKLVNKYGDNLQVTSEQAISAGTLDIAIFPGNAIAMLPDNRIVFKYNEKVIGTRQFATIKWKAI